jgi:hypothetical protein
VKNWFQSLLFQIFQIQLDQVHDGGGGGGKAATESGAVAELGYERVHSCPLVTAEVLAALEEGRVVFDVYLQQDGGASAGGLSDDGGGVLTAVGLYKLKSSYNP